MNNFKEEYKGLIISPKNKEDIFLGFKTKLELKNNTFYQFKLKQFKEELKQNGATIECACKKIPMSCKFTNYYFLSNLPNNSYKHKQDCIYYKNLENLTDENDKYKSLIFKEPVFIQNATMQQKTEYVEKETHRKNTYNNFCIDMISEAISIAFNVKNKNIENRESLLYPNTTDFLEKFNNLANKNDFLVNNSIANSLDDGYCFSYGLVDCELSSLINKNEEEYNIILKEAKKSFINGNFQGFEFKNLDCLIKYNTLLNSSNLIKNFSNYIAPPYFYIAIYKQYKNINKIIRLFLHPIFFNKNYVVFVDSGFERKYAKYLLDNKIPFIKPITDSCFFKVNGKFLNYKTNDNKTKRAYLKFLPDFIEFYKDKVCITEVSGYDNIEYNNLLDRKIEHYESEARKSRGLYCCKRVDGKLI